MAIRILSLILTKSGEVKLILTTLSTFDNTEHNLLAIVWMLFDTTQYID